MKQIVLVVLLLVLAALACTQDRNEVRIPRPTATAVPTADPGQEASYG